MSSTNDPFTPNSALTATASTSNSATPADSNGRSTCDPSPSSRWIQESDTEKGTDEVGLVPHNRGYKHILFLMKSIAHVIEVPMIIP